MPTLGSTDLEVFPLCLGGNVFGWTAGEEDAFAVLDAYVAAGGNFVDTADVYRNGESEAIIGRWASRRGVRDRLVIATKVGNAGGLGRANVRERVHGSLERLQSDRVELLYAHRDDVETPLEETVAAFDELVREGSVRHVAASNYEAPRLAEALEIADRGGHARFVALQPHYNLVERGEYEGELAELCAREGLSCVPYFALARGFLTGKYRPGGPEVESPRAERARAYLDGNGPAVLEALDEVAGAHETTVAAVALAWLAAQPTVAAPIASARSAEQLSGLLPFTELELSGDELARLDRASRP